MLPTSSVFLTTLALLHGIAVIAQDDSCSVCEDVHFFLARGNNEPYPGRQGALVAATCEGLNSCGYENLYYSTLYTDLYCQTAYDGSIAGHVQMTAYAQKCPKSKLILAGYSQGGQIAGDILGGGGGYSFNGCLQPDTPNMPRDSSPGNQIAAVIIFGDTRHTANQKYNFGNGSAIDGLYPRPGDQLSNLEQYADIMRDWCISTDPICAANQTFFTKESHLGYYDRDSQAAASWIRSVASLTQTASFTTAIPTSLSGTVQNYATIGTATPSGSVTLDTTWTSSTSYAACTPAPYDSLTSSSTATATSASGAVTSSDTSDFPTTSTPDQPDAISTSQPQSGQSATSASGGAIFYAGAFGGAVLGCMAGAGLLINVDL